MISICLITALLAFAYLAFILWLKSHLKKDELLQNSSLPSIAVVVPFRNEGNNIRDLISALQKQNYEGSWEVVLINDHSTDNGVAEAQNAIDQSRPERIKVLHLPNELSGKKAALTYGVEHTDTELIVQTDADCFMASNWLSGIASSFTPETELLIGSVAMEAIPKSFWSKFAALEYLSLQASGQAMAMGGHPIMGSAANLAYRRHNFYQQGGKSQSSGDDVFLIQSIAARSRNAVLASIHPTMQVYTPAPETFKEFITQRARWGSKTGSYTSPVALLTAAFIAVYNTGIVILIIAGIMFPFLWVCAGILYLFKAIPDYFFLRRYACITNQSALMEAFPSVCLLYPFYITTAILAMMTGIKWKGRTIRK